MSTAVSPTVPAIHGSHGPAIPPVPKTPPAPHAPFAAPATPATPTPPAHPAPAVEIPTISFTNHTDSGVMIYDSYSDNDSSNYFGKLTQMTKVPANSKATIQPLHPISTLIVSNEDTNDPMARFIVGKLVGHKPISVGPADVKAMKETMNFITFILSHPSDPLTTSFMTLIKASTSPVTPVDQFFAQHAAYSSCTFVTYMMGMIVAAEVPATKSKPLDQSIYSLSNLVSLMGGTWPSAFSDILLTDFTCDTENDVLAIRGTIDLSKLPAQSDQALKFFGSLFKVQQLQVTITINYGFSLGVLGTRLSISLDALHVPFESSSLTVSKPTATIDINPLFKFVVFTVTGSIPFSIFGKTLECDISMLEDNLEATFGVVIKGDNTSLPAPPVMKGVHFDEFGVGLGVFFEPPSASIGLSGKFHIGSPGNSLLQLADDQFAVVCQVVEEVPNPLYISFYVPQMHLTDVLTVFTNVQTQLDLPVSFTDLSFKWSENPMEPIALPDGTLSSMGYGFVAAAKILAFSFYGDIEIDLDHGLTADIEMSPLSLGNIFSIGGAGTGFSIKVDAKGNPIKNNLLPTTAAQQAALKAAATKQLVPPGGPVLKLQTFTSPFLFINGHVSLFEVYNQALQAVITTSGMSFRINFGSVLTTAMSCTLADYHNLSATFSFGIDQTLSLGSIAGVSIGSIPLKAVVAARMSLSTSSSSIVLTVGGSFDFEGVYRYFGNLTIDANFSTISGLLSHIVSYIENTAASIFADLIHTGAAWAGSVKRGLITGANSVAIVLNRAYGQAASQVASTMKGAGYSANEVADEMKNVFNPTEVGNCLKNVYGLSAQGVAQTMRQVGYAGQEVASALKTIFGNDAEQVASALRGAYGWSNDQINSALHSIGFPPDQIAHAFESLGGGITSIGGDIAGGFRSIFHF